MQIKTFTQYPILKITHSFRLLLKILGYFIVLKVETSVTKCGWEDKLTQWIFSWNWQVYYPRSFCIKCPKRKSLGGLVRVTVVSPQGVTVPAETGTRPFPPPIPLVSVHRPSKALLVPIRSVRKSSHSKISIFVSVFSFSATSLSSPHWKISKTFGILGILFMLLWVRKWEKELHLAT